MKRSTIMALAIAGLVVAKGIGRSYAATFAFTTLDDPAASPGNTQATGISGSTVVGYYFGTDNKYHGFSETGGAYTPLNATGASSSGITYVYGISGSTTVGYYWDSNDVSHGFVETGGVYISLDDPSAIIPAGLSEGFGTIASGISGNIVVGSFSSGIIGYNHGFSETNGVYSPLDDPAAAGGYGTNANGISGNTVVGQFWDSSGIIHGFSETNGVYTTLTDPSASNETIANGISGNTVAGTFYDNAGLAHGFVETNGVYTTVDAPGATQTYVLGIDGNTISGYYDDSTGAHGFTAVDIAAVPVPSSAWGGLALLAGLGVTNLIRRRLYTAA